MNKKASIVVGSIGCALVLGACDEGGGANPAAPNDGSAGKADDTSSPLAAEILHNRSIDSAHCIAGIRPLEDGDVGPELLAEFGPDEIYGTRILLDIGNAAGAGTPTIEFAAWTDVQTPVVEDTAAALGDDLCSDITNTALINLDLTTVTFSESDDARKQSLLVKLLQLHKQRASTTASCETCSGTWAEYS